MKKMKHWIKAKAEAMWRKCKQTVHDLDKWMETDEANIMLPLLTAISMIVKHLAQMRNGKL